MGNLEKLAIKQAAKIEALEWFFQYTQDRTSPTIEGAIEKLENNNLNAYRSLLIELWEKQNAPYKWEQE